MKNTGLVPAALASLAFALPGVSGSVLHAAPPSGYAGRPYRDAVHARVPQRIPGPVFCAYYDSGGEGVAYHDTEAANQGSGKLNPADGSYLNEFRRQEGCDTSYTKPMPDLESPCNKVTPPLGLLYVGWTEPGEWFKLAVETSEAGTYTADVLYTSQRGGGIGIDVDGTSAHSIFSLESTFDPAETIPWRQWHHWNVARDAFEVTLPKGVSVMTVRIVTNGNLNLATFDFRLKGSLRTGPGITAVKTPSPTPANRGESVKRVVVWDGEQANVGAGWVNPTTSTLKPQSVEAHSGNTALEFKFKGTNQWMGMGWNWFKFKTGTNAGTDASAMKNLCFWIRAKGKVGGTLRVNLLCNGDVLDTPEEHTVKVEVLKYCPAVFDGQWREVVIPMADLDQIKGFNRSIISEIHLGLTPEQDTDGSFFIDDIGFDDRGGEKHSAAAAIDRPDGATAMRSPAEMLVNGNFADGTNHWVVVGESGATGRAEMVGEGPDGKAALRLKVLTRCRTPRGRSKAAS